MSVAASLAILAAATPVQHAPAVKAAEPVAIQASASVTILAGTQIRFRQRRSDGEHKPQMRDGRDGTVWFEFS